VITTGSEKVLSFVLAKVVFCFQELLADEKVTPLPYPVMWEVLAGTTFSSVKCVWFFGFTEVNRYFMAAL
jgi:hypothetical protein